MAIDGLTGFEFEDPLAFFSSVTSTVVPVIDTTTVHSGVASMKCSPGAYGIQTQTAGVRTKALSFWFYLDHIPTGASAGIFRARNATGTVASVYMSTSTGIMFGQTPTSGAVSGGAVTVGEWHRLEVSVDTSTTTYRLKWRIDGVAKTDATFVAAAAGDITEYQIGEYNASSTSTVWIDDVVTGSVVADHPIGDYHVLGYSPTGVGTHVTPSNFTRTGTALTSGDTTSWTAIDETPPTTTDYVEQATASGTSYLEYALADTVEPAAPSYVQAFAALNSSSVGTNNSITRIRDGASNGDVYTGSTNGTATTYASAFFATKPSGGAWTLAAFNATTLRFGFSTTTTPPPRLHSFMLEAAYPASVSVTKSSSDTLGLGDTSTLTTAGSGSVPVTGSDTFAVFSETAGVAKAGQTQNSFQQSGLWGAGFQNVVAPSPLVSGLVLSGGDTSGIHRSSDRGDTWVTQNEEITVFSDRAIADIRWHPTQSGRVFRLSGNGTIGSFWESTNQGLTWSKRSTIPAAAGTSHLGLTDTGEHPRSIGHLIVVDTTNGYVYVASYNDGIYRATLGATSGVGTFTRIALGPNSTGGAYYVRALVADSNDPDTLYASTYMNAAATEGTTLSGRVWRIENASTASPAAVQFTNSPLCVEDMIHLGTALYCVAYESPTGDRGLWTLNNSLTAAGSVARGGGVFSNWLNRTVAVPFTTEVWYSIDGVLSGTNLTLYCGCTNPVSDAAGAFKVLFKAVSSDSGATMTSDAIHPAVFSTTGTTGNVRKQVGGISGERDWWMFPRQTGSMFGKSGYAAASIGIDKSGATTSGGGSTGSTIKKPVQGIIDPQVSTIPSGYAGAINALTVYLDWVDLQPTSTSLLDGGDVTVLDNMLTYAAANNIYIKVRLFTGAKHNQSGVTGAPAWLVSQTGTFLSKNSQDPGNATAIAKFWTPAFKTAYDNLMKLMAARWDSEPRLLDITISGAMTRYAEPFIRDLGTAQNRAELVGGGVGWSGTFIAVPGAGYTDALNQSAHKSFIDSHARWWTTTNSSLAFNPYQRLDSYSSHTTNDVAIRRSLLAYFKNALGVRGVIENNSVRPDYFTYDANDQPTGFSQTVPSYTTMYQDHLTYPPPYFYQTANNTQITNTTYTTVQSAMLVTQRAADQILKANAVEPASGVGSFTVANVNAWNTTLENNPIPTGGGSGSGSSRWPATGVLFGSYVDSSNTGDGESKAEITARETQLGRTYAIDGHFYGQSVPSDGLVEWDITSGRCPLITTAFSWGSGTFPGYAAAQSGTYDTMYHNWATYLKGLSASATVIVRLFQEFNGTWFNFGAGTSGYNPGFANMWRYIWNLWNADGVDLGGRIQICWCPNTESGLGISAATTDAGYPGDGFVDCIGIDLYNKDTGGTGGGLTFQNGVSGIYGRYAATGKPFIVPEFGCVDHVLDQRKNWFNAMKTYINGGTVPLLKALVYWDAVGTATDAVSGSLFEYRTDKTSSGNSTSATDSFTAWTGVANDANFQAEMGTTSSTGGGGVTQYPNKSRVFIGGRSGIWRTQNADAAEANVLFYPDVRNLGVTICRPLLCDPGDPDKVYSGSTDWTFIMSTDALVNVDMNDTGIAASVGLSLAVDETTTPSTVYIGVGTRDTNTLGGVFANTNPTAGTTWTTTNLEAAAGGAQPIGLTFMRNASNQAVLIAAVTGQIPGDTTNATSAGIYRKVGTGAWTKVTNITPTGVVMVGEASRSATMTSRRGSPNVYLMDGATGIWRSTDYGASWTRILIHTASNADYVGYVSCHPTDTNILYASLSTGVYQINNASTVAQDSAALIDISGGIVQNPGAMKTTSNGLIYCVSRVVPKLWRSSVTAPSSWSSVDDAVFRDTAIFAQDIDIDTAGRVYIATNGNGIIRQVTTAYSDNDTFQFADTATVTSGSNSHASADTAHFDDTATISTTAGTPAGVGTKKKWPKRS